MKSLKKICSDHKPAVFLYAGGVVAIILFSLYCYLFWHNFDSQVSDIIRQDRGEIFAATMGFISWWGMSYVMVLSVFVAALLFYMASFKREAWFTLSVFVADIINIVLKMLIGRPRPEAMDIFPKFQQASFPSGHVVHYAVFFGFILTVMLVHPRVHPVLRWLIGLLCAFLIVGVSIARIYLGTHWATDILAAYAVGFILLAVIILRYLKGVPNRNDQ